jgi:hypothetical protein
MIGARANAAEAAAAAHSDHSLAQRDLHDKRQCEQRFRHLHLSVYNRLVRLRVLGLTSATAEKPGTAHCVQDR